MTINLSHSKEITKVPSAMRATPACYCCLLCNECGI